MEDIDMHEIFECLSNKINKIINYKKLTLVQQFNDVSIYLKDSKEKILQIYKNKSNTLEVVLVVLFLKELLPDGFHEYQIKIEKNSEKYYVKNNENTNLKLIEDQECQELDDACDILIELLNQRLQEL